ncbi:DUF2497 domain-containing protein [Sandarakinorhabdus sp.]|uniref:DUF2497 domain-containing protein n=1 Tax=Sandarakinorhabdus sp. TaxID=1916663 RepID=UPI00286DF4D0|nr:DUF2497 domain-containing protein [Sandarakinorhabdus sp.]
MSDLPPTIDAILASIRARVTGDDAEDEGAALVAPPPPPVMIAEVGAVEITPTIGAMTLDTLMRQMMTPMLKAWLDAHMPEIVERLAREEIRRLTGKM